MPRIKKDNPTVSINDLKSETLRSWISYVDSEKKHSADRQDKQEQQLTYWWSGQREEQQTVNSMYRE